MTFCEDDMLPFFLRPHPALCYCPLGPEIKVYADSSFHGACYASRAQKGPLAPLISAVRPNEMFTVCICYNDGQIREHLWSSRPCEWTGQVVARLPEYAALPVARLQCCHVLCRQLCPYCMPPLPPISSLFSWVISLLTNNCFL